MHSKPSVIVVGAGPVGLLVGLRLAKAGIHTTILERLPAIENSPRAAAYQPVAVQELDRASILEACRAIGTTGSKLAFRRQTGEVILELSRVPTPEEPYENLVLGQHELVRVILDNFEQCETAQVLFEHFVVGIDQDDTGVTATVETPDGTKELTASYLVGADGGRSSVWQLYGYAPGNMIVHKDNYAVIAKLNEQGLWRVSYGELGGLSERELRDRLPMKYDALLPGPRPLHYDLRMFSPYRIHQKWAKTFRIGRVLLAGDAAHLCNPFGGLGLTGGLLDAGALGDALIATINDKAPESILDRYSQVRRDIFLKVIDPTSQANIRRLYENDPESILRTDPFLRAVHSADEKEKEKIRGMQTGRVELLPN
ncbi:hypothetical protein DTO271G3_5197 [Paecilomyces variotii]|nr:hypothetical protein DTO271G3_5197 [Paecilomyces variotii]